MPRPERRIIASGIASWDGDVDRNFSIITDGPFPMFQVALEGDLPAASSYDDCLAIVGTGSAAELYISDGSAWSVYQQSTLVPDSTATTAADMASDFNDLLAAFQTAGLMATS